jgi:pimeloyl-ACP methyl ester carboxylesterase
MSGVGYVAAAYAVSRYLTHPRRRPIGVNPLEVGIERKPLEIVAEDGITLAGWLFEPANPRGTVALFHGMRRNREQLLSRVAFLVAAGFRCITIDHRAHGESGGKRVSFGWYEARDVKAVAKWIAENRPAEPRYALGISMGAAAICYAGPECGWKGIILECVYADLRNAFKRRIGALYPAWFGQLYPGTIWFTQKRLRVRMSDLRPAAAAQRFHGVRVLGMAGTKDLLAPLADTFEVLASIPGPTESSAVPGAGHNDVCEIGGEVYQKRIVAFLRNEGAASIDFFS